jgi:hypothetical protein
MDISQPSLQFLRDLNLGRNVRITVAQSTSGAWEFVIARPMSSRVLSGAGFTLEVRGELDITNGQWIGSAGFGWQNPVDRVVRPPGTGFSGFAGLSVGGPIEWGQGGFEISSDGSVYVVVSFANTQNVPLSAANFAGQATFRQRLGTFEEIAALLPQGLTRDRIAPLPPTLDNPDSSEPMPEVIIERTRGTPLRLDGSVDQLGRLLLEPGAAEELRAAMEDISAMGIIPRIPRCFLAGTPILMADGQEKPIEDIRVGDLVMSFDPSADQGRGALVPKPVSRTFQNITRSIIDLRGLHMTPGHVCLTDDGRFETIAEILLRDGILVEADGTPIRARTGAKIGSMEDIPVLIAYPDEKTGKEIFVRARAGIPCLLVRERDGTMRHLSLALMLRAYHQTLTPEGLIQSPDGSLGEATDWPEDSTPMDEDYRRNWVIQTADGKPYVPEWILEVASEAREEQTVGATLQRIVSPPSQRFAPKVVDNPTPPARNRAERRAQKHRGSK